MLATKVITTKVISFFLFFFLWMLINATKFSLLTMNELWEIIKQSSDLRYLIILAMISLIHNIPKPKTVGGRGKQLRGKTVMTIGYKIHFCKVTRIYSHLRFSGSIMHTIPNLKLKQGNTLCSLGMHESRWSNKRHTFRWFKFQHSVHVWFPLLSEFICISDTLPCNWRLP